MNQKTILILGIALVVLLVAGCAQTKPTGATPVKGGTESIYTQPGGPTEANIEIKDFGFNPSSLTIRSGVKITWAQEDSVRHTIVSDTALFESPELAKGETFSFTFTQLGTYTYHCSLHPSMIGTIIVQ